MKNQEINTEKPVVMDKCVSCGIDTPYPVGTSIDQRENYVIGGGQLCNDCAKKIYSKLP